jgi:DNA polymerase-1
MVFAIDTETDGLKHSHGNRAFAIGYTDAKEEPCIVYPETDDLVVLDTMLLAHSNEWVGHNIGFDLPFIADFHMAPTGTIHDTMIAAHIYNNLEPEKNLASLATKYCGILNTEDERLEEWFQSNGYNKDNRNYKNIPLNILEPYLKADLRRTLALFKFYKSKGVIDDPAYKLEMSVVPVVMGIEARGMCVDVQYAKDELKKAITLISGLEMRAHQEFGVENIGSVQQIAEALFTRGGLTCTTFTDKKNICLDETAIKQYDHPLVNIVLEHREISKLTGTYLETIVKKSHEGRLHSSLKQVGARTGRFSSSDPNLQNIPRTDERSPVNLRKAFICSDESKLLLVDLSQIELRILAHYSKEPEMIKTLTDRKGDIHKTTAIQMFGEVNDELRTVAKTLNFAVIYGAGGEALVEQLNKALPNRKTTLAQAKDFKAKFFKGYPLVQQFLWDVQKRIAERGYVLGKSGRKYHCEADKAYRASNYLIQGESAMLMKHMMVDIENLLVTHKTKLINIIHDEMIFDLNYAETHLIPSIVETIENCDNTWRVPIYANAAISDTNWAEKRKVTS